MSYREQMEKAVNELAETHEQNRAEYRAAMEAKAKADKRLRDANQKASVSANELGAMRKALEELDRNTPAQTVEGSGEIQSGGSAGEGE